MFNRPLKSMFSIVYHIINQLCQQFECYCPGILLFKIKILVNAGKYNQGFYNTKFALILLNLYTIASPPSCNNTLYVTN